MLEIVDVQKMFENLRREPLFWPQDGPKMAPRPVQDGSKRDQKSHAFFVLIFDSFWGRLGVALGPILGAKIDP